MRQEFDNYIHNNEYAEDDMNVSGEWRQLPLSLSDAVMNVMSSYGDVTGRASRSEFWWWVAFVSVFLPCVNILSQMIGFEVIWVFAAGLLVIPSLCVMIRRIHDSGHSSWWLLLALTGVGVIVVLYLLLRGSEPETNEWGHQPNMLRVDY